MNSYPNNLNSYPSIYHPYDKVYELTGRSCETDIRNAREYTYIIEMLMSRESLNTFDKAGLCYVFDKLNVPDNLSLKERITYYQLLGDSKCTS